MSSLPRGGGGDSDEDEGGQSELIEATSTRVAGAILRDCTSDGSAAAVTPDGDPPNKYCPLCRKHGYWKFRCPSQVCATCKRNGLSSNVCPSGQEGAVVADFHTDLDPQELLAFEALVAEPRTSLRRSNTARKQVSSFVADSGKGKPAFPSST